MHPVIIEAIAAERARETQAYAEAAELARQFRRGAAPLACTVGLVGLRGLRRLSRPLLRAQVRDGAV